MTKNKNETTRVLRVNLTDAQKLEFGQQLAQEHQTVAQTNSDFDRVKAEFKSKLTRSEAIIVDLSNKVSTGYEMRVVPCLWEMDYPKPGKKTLFRTDNAEGTPRETVETCDMEEIEKTPELQLPLNPVLPAGTGIAKDGSVTVPADGAAAPDAEKK